MIDARELRIGNWVYILSNIQITRGSDIDYAATGADPIPLTPEILEKVGFKKAKLRTESDTDWLEEFDFDGVYDMGGYNVFYMIDDFILAGLRDDDKEWALVYENAGYDENAHIYTQVKVISSLHQLQNLFFSLCDKELEIKL